MDNKDRHFFDHDLDPTETQEWVEALEAVLAHDGAPRARQLIEALVGAAGRLGVDPGLPLTTPYRNTISPEDQPPFTGDITIEERLSAIIRWNALVMVVRMKAKGAGASLGARELALDIAEAVYEPSVAAHIPGVANVLADFLSRMRGRGEDSVPEVLRSARRRFLPRRDSSWWRTL